MRALVSAIVAAGLIFPATASAQRWTTPGTHERLKEARENAKAEPRSERKSEKPDREAREPTKVCPRAARAGKVNRAYPGECPPD
jgi:hypothetical protein